MVAHIRQLKDANLDESSRGVASGSPGRAMLKRATRYPSMHHYTGILVELLGWHWVPQPRDMLNTMGRGDAVRVTTSLLHVDQGSLPDM